MGISMDYFKQTENAASFEIIFQKLTSTEGSTNCTYVFFTRFLSSFFYTQIIFSFKIFYMEEKKICV